jgi:diguanylate cyclase (GGDEF)-like protein
VIQRELDSRIEKNEPFAAIYVDIDNFKAYNDVYGFLTGDLAIKMTADILCDAAGNIPCTFIGHIGGDDFFALVPPEEAEPVCRTIVENFDARIVTLYSAQDLDRGYVVSSTARVSRRHIRS